MSFFTLSYMISRGYLYSGAGMDGGSKLSYKGRWVGLGIMLANSVVWSYFFMLVEKRGASPLFILLIYAVNGMIGYGLGALYDRVKHASLLDELTHAYNRRVLKKHVPSLLAKTARRRSCLSVTLIDCDNFKRINDHYGHAAGDTVLKNISSLLMQNTRSNDLVVRWGGDEFLIIARDADQDKTEKMMRRLGFQLEELSGQLNIELSVSVGTAVYPTDADRMEQLIQIADRNMYHLKSVRKETATC